MAWSSWLPPMPKLMLMLMALVDEAPTMRLPLSQPSTPCLEVRDRERTVRRMVALLKSQHHLAIEPGFPMDGSRTRSSIGSSWTPKRPPCSSATAFRCVVRERPET